MDDKTQDKWLKILWGNQQQILKNGDTYWEWVQYLDKANKNQDAIDKQTNSTLKDLGTKIVAIPDILLKNKEIEQRVATLELQLNSHKEVENVEV